MDIVLDAIGLWPFRTQEPNKKTMTWSCSNYDWDAFALDEHCHAMAKARAEIVTWAAILSSSTEVEDLVELIHAERKLEKLQAQTRELLPF